MNSRLIALRPFSPSGLTAASTSIVMGNRAFMRMWAARRAAKFAGMPLGAVLPKPALPLPTEAQPLLAP